MPPSWHYRCSLQNHESRRWQPGSSTSPDPTPSLADARVCQIAHRRCDHTLGSHSGSCSCCCRDSDCRGGCDCDCEGGSCCCRDCDCRGGCDCDCCGYGCRCDCDYGCKTCCPPPSLPSRSVCRHPSFRSQQNWLCALAHGTSRLHSCTQPASLEGSGAAHLLASPRSQRHLCKYAK